MEEERTLLSNMDASKLKPKFACNQQQSEEKKTYERQQGISNKNMRYKTKQWYEQQIPDGYSNKLVKIWNGNSARGDWTSVTQLTAMGQVKNRKLKRGGKPAVVFHGAIVAFGDALEGNYYAIPSSRFECKVVCYAKKGLNNMAMQFVAKRLTGIIDFSLTYNVGNQLTGIIDFSREHDFCSSSTGFVLVEWDNKEKDWIPGCHVEDIGIIQQRKKRCPPPKPLNVVPFPSSNNKNVKTYYKFFSHETISGKGYGPVKLIQDADLMWLQHSACNIMSDFGITNIIIPARPNVPYLELSLIFDMLRGDISGSVGDNVDKALKIKQPEIATMEYANAIQGWLFDSLETQRKMKMRNISHKRKTGNGTCSMDGCKTNVHTLFAKSCVCYHHAPKSLKQLRQSPKVNVTSSDHL